MNHLNPDEILHAGHGWLDDPEDAIAQAHAESCDECAEAVRRVRAEREILRAATTNPEISHQEVNAMTAAILTMPQVRQAARPGFVTPGLGLTLAASILAIAAGLVLFESNGGMPPTPLQEKPALPLESEATRIRKLVRVFIGPDAQKSRDAKAELLKAGKLAIRILIEEQKTLSDMNKFYRLSDVLFTLKFQGDTSPGSVKFRKAMGSGRMSYITQEELPLWELFDGWRVAYEGNRRVDNPSSDKCASRLRYEIIDAQLRGEDLDYAVRFGMVIVAPPDQLWAYPGIKSRPGDGAAVDQWIVELYEGSEKSERAEAMLLDQDDWILERLRTAAAKEGSDYGRDALARILREFTKRQQAPLFDNACAVDGQALSAVAAAWSKQTLALPSYIVQDLDSFRRLRLDLATTKITEMAVGEPGTPVTRLTCSELMADTRLAELRCYGDAATAPTTLRDVLILLLRPAGLDFCIREGAEPTISVDAPAAIRALIQEQEKKK